MINTKSIPDEKETKCFNKMDNEKYYPFTLTGSNVQPRILLKRSQKDSYLVKSLLWKTSSPMMARMPSHNRDTCEHGRSGGSSYGQSSSLFGGFETKLEMVSLKPIMRLFQTFFSGLIKLVSITLDR